MAKSIGFTGSRLGLTPAQCATLEKFIQFGGWSEGHHGDCVGGDAVFHKLLLKHGVKVAVHPPDNKSLRAWCVGPGVRELGPLPYLERNKQIVKAINELVACPLTRDEQLRSGTWYTIRLARKMNKPITIIFQDGNVRKEPC